MSAAISLPIGELSKASGVKVETIRYYEKIGVMPAPARTGSGYRAYGPEHLNRLKFVRRGRELGFSLEELRGLLHLVDGRAQTCAEVRAMTLAHGAEIRRKIADLRRLERGIAAIARRCTGRRVPDCPIIDALFGTPPPSSARRSKR
jgi:MerR family mercuric resistance operon transcriptional regulator